MGKAAKSGYGLHKVASERLDKRELRSASLFLFVLSIFFTACLCRPAPTHAQWASIGPDGGYILAVAVNPSNPNVVYAGTDGGGVFKNTKSGLAACDLIENLDSEFEVEK